MSQGKITVVLHWEKEHPLGQPPALQVLKHQLKVNNINKQKSTSRLLEAPP